MIAAGINPTFCGISVAGSGLLKIGHSCCHQKKMQASQQR
jgi:hypothetical protein